MKSLGEQIFIGKCLGPDPQPCTTLTRVSARDLALKETWFRDSIFMEPELVISPCRPTGRIPTGERWLPWRTEINFGSGPIDVLLVSSYGRIGIIETKLSYNPQKRREVVAQILDYALALQELEIEDLPDLPDSEDAPDVEDLQEALSAGRFLLLIAGDALDARAMRLSQTMLASHLTSEWDLAMIDLNLYKAATGEGDLIIVPELLGAVVREVRQVVRINVEGSVARTRVVVERAVSDDVAPRRSMPAQLQSTDEFLTQLRIEVPEIEKLAIKILDELQSTASLSGGLIEFGLARNSANLYFRPSAGPSRRMVAFKTNGRFRLIQRYLRAAGYDDITALLRQAARPIMTLEEEAGSSRILVSPSSINGILEFLHGLQRGIMTIPS